MTEQEQEQLLKELARLKALRSQLTGKKGAINPETDNILFTTDKPSLPSSLLAPSTSARLARTQQATGNALGVVKPKAVPVRNAPDTGATSLVTNKVTTTPTRTAPTRTPASTPPPSLLSYAQAQKALTASEGGKPAKGLEAVDKAFRDTQAAKTLDEQFATDLALKQALGQDTMKGRTAEQLRQGEVLRQGRGTPYVAPDTAQKDLEAAVITTLLGIAPGVGGQLAVGAASKLIPEATQVARPMLSNVLRGGAAIGGAVGTAKLQDVALESALGTPQYEKMQQDMAAFQGRQPLLTAMLQGGAGAIMQRPSLAASLGERLVGAGMGAGLSVGGDIMAGQPIDLAKAGTEALANVAFAGPNTKAGDILETAGAKAVSPLVPKVRQAPKNLTGTPALYRQGEVAPSTVPSDVSFVDPNAPVQPPVKPAVPKTSAQAPSKTKVAVPMGEAGTVAPESLISTAPTTRKGKASPYVSNGSEFDMRGTNGIPPETAPPVETPPVQEPVKQTGDLLTRPAEPVKETPKPIQVEEPTPTLQAEPKLETAESTAPKPEPLTPARRTILAREVQSALADVNHPDKATSEAARARLTTALDTLRADGAIKGEGVKLTDAITDRESFRKSVQDAFNLPDDQADEVANLVDDWAHGWAKKNDATPADFYATVKGIHSFDDDLTQLVLGTGAKTAKGARLPQEGVITALKRGDVSTAVHEMAHHFLDTLPESARKAVMDAFPGATKENAHELFAKGFEAGLKDPNSPLHRYYTKFKSWLDDVYGKSIAQWRKATGYVEGGLRVQEDRNGKKVVSFVTGLPKDAHDVVMDYINTGRMEKGSTVEGKEPVITQVNKGVDESRVQQGQPPYFVNWQEDGKNNYKFFVQVPSMYKFYDDLKLRESGKTASTDVAPRVEAVAPKAEAVPTKVKLADTIAESNPALAPAHTPRPPKRVLTAEEQSFVEGKVNQRTGLTDKQTKYLQEQLTALKQSINADENSVSGSFNKKTGEVYMSKPGETTIDVPGDGKYVVKNNTESVQFILDEIGKKSEGSSQFSKAPIRDEVDNLILSYGNAEKTLASLDRQISRMEASEDFTPKDVDAAKRLRAEVAKRGDAVLETVAELRKQDAEFQVRVNKERALKDKIIAKYPEKVNHRDLVVGDKVVPSTGSYQGKPFTITEIRRVGRGDSAFTSWDAKGSGGSATSFYDTSPLQYVKRVNTGEPSEPQFQQADDDTTTIFDVPLKNAAIQGFFDVDPETLRLKTTVKAEMKSALELAQTPGFAEKVIKQVLNGENVLTPKFTAQNIVVAAEASERRAKWEALKNSDAPQSEVDKAYNDYMKMVNASYLLGREPGMALRMRQEMVATADPLDPDSYISKAAGMYTGKLSDPEFKAFVERVTAKSATARQSHDSLMSEVDRLSKAYDESQAALAQANTDKATLEAEKKKIEDQLFSKKPSKTPSKPKETPSTTSGTTTPNPISTIPDKVRRIGYERGAARLKVESSDEAISASKQKALSGAERLKALAKKFQFQQDDDIADIDDDVSGHISEGRQALIDIGQGLLASGTRNFKTWKEEISGFLGEAGIDDLEDHQYQVLWVDSKLALRDEVPDVNTGVKKSSIAGTAIQKVIGSLSLEGAQNWLDNISDTDGNPVIFEKLVKGQDLTLAELDVAARAWMAVQKAQGQKISKRGKVGALEDIKRVARELKAQETAPRKDITMDAALESISKMTEGLGKNRMTAENPVMRARLARFNGAVKALAKRYIGDGTGQMSATEFKALVDNAATEFKDAGTDVDKHQQVLRDLRSNAMRGVGLDPNVRYQFSQYKTDAEAMAAVKAKVDNQGKGLAELVRDYASGRKESKPNDLLSLATVEYAKAGESIIAWSKAVENRWGSKIDRNKLDALYAMAAVKFHSMKDPATEGSVPYAVQVKRIKEEMQYEVDKVSYNQRDTVDKAVRVVGEVSQALVGNIASFDYSFAGRQAGAALLLSPDLYAKALREGVKAAGVGKVSPEELTLAFDKQTNAFFNDKFGDSQYYKKVGLEITDDSFSDIYTHHGLITPTGRFVSDTLSTVGFKPGLKIGARIAEVRGDPAKAARRIARSETMIGPGQRSEAMNRMFVKQLRVDLFRRVAKDGVVYKELLDGLENATTPEEKAAIQKKIDYQDQFNKTMAKVISITTGKAAVERQGVRQALTVLGRYGIWSPSFWLSRVQAMTAYPAWDVMFGENNLGFQDRLKIAAIPIGIQQAEIAAFNLSLFLLSRIPGVQIMGTDDDEVENRKTPWNWLGLDPLNTDFGKVKYQGQEYDLSCGFRKHIVFAQRTYQLAAQGLYDWKRESQGKMPNSDEYDPYNTSKVSVEDGKRQLFQYVKSAANPIASSIYDVTRGGATDALGRKTGVLDTAIRLALPIPIANVLYSTTKDWQTQKQDAERTQNPEMMKLFNQDTSNLFRDLSATGLADLMGISSAVRDRQMEDTMKQMKKHTAWQTKGAIPTKEEDRLRQEVTKSVKNYVALSGTGDMFPSKKAVEEGSKSILKDLELDKMNAQGLIQVKRMFKEQEDKGRKLHPYMKTTPFNLSLPTSTK